MRRHIHADIGESDYYVCIQHDVFISVNWIHLTFAHVVL